MSVRPWTARRQLAQPDGRKRDLAAIHVCKKTLNLSDDEYRDLMATVCGGIRSAALLDQSGRQRFLAHLAACQRANSRPSGVAASKGDRRPLKPHERKIWSLWMQLADVGLVDDRSMRAINSWARRHTQVDSIAFLNRHQQELVIESLKRWLARKTEATEVAA